MTNQEEAKSPNEMETVYSCRECQAGHMHQTFITYMTWMGMELITVPDFPAWVCDVCGRREYDRNALRQLKLLLSPTVSDDPKLRRSAPNNRDLPKNPPGARP